MQSENPIQLCITSPARVAHLLATSFSSHHAGYSIGGTLHLVVNNQLGFTTTPMEGRSGVHATDVAKLAGAPILHVNADDPEAVVAAAIIAADWRAAWGRDAVLDIVGYRR